MGDLWTVPTAGGQPRRLTADITEISDPIWTADGRFIIYSSLRGGSRVLWRMPTHGGAPEPLTVGSGDDIEPALSPDGHTLIYTNVRTDWQLVVLEAAGGGQRTIVQRRTEVLWPRVSSDGSRIAFFARGPFGDPQIFITSFDGRNNQQLTRGRAQINTMPRWSPDGSRIYFYENRPTDTFRVMPRQAASARRSEWPMGAVHVRGTEARRRDDIHLPPAEGPRRSRASGRHRHSQPENRRHASTPADAGQQPLVS